MVDIFVSCIAAIISLILSGAYLKRKEFDKSKGIRFLLPSNKVQWLVLFGIVISMSCVVAFSCSVYNQAWLHTTERVILVAFLWVLACIDYQNYIIPNKILAVMILGWILFVAIKAVSEPQNIKKIILSDLIACAAIAVVLSLMRLITRGSIGFGDIKLFAVLGLYFGLQGIIVVLFTSFIASFIISVILLVSKKKAKNDKLAFAPFILMGCLSSIIFFGV